jgi:hypothetical protein
VFSNGSSFFSRKGRSYEVAYKINLNRYTEMCIGHRVLTSPPQKKYMDGSGSRWAKITYKKRKKCIVFKCWMSSL